MAGEDEWVSWPEAAAIVGCPIPTIDWYSRVGRIEKRPFRGSRPSLRRASVLEFAAWWEQRQRLRQQSRAAGVTAAAGRTRRPPDLSGWLCTREGAEVLGVSEGHVLWLIGHHRLDALRRGGRWWVPARSAAQLQRDRDDEQSRWVSAAEAARIVGCSQNAILRAAHRGEITQRRVPRQRPSLARSSVEEFKALWTSRVSARAGAQQPAGRPASAPLDDQHEWLSTRQAAQVLGLSASRINQLARLEMLPATTRANRRWYRADHLRLLRNARTASRDLSRR